MFHAFIDYVRLLRTACYQFDAVSADDLDDLMPFSYDVVNCTLDYKMDFSILCDGTGSKEGAMCSTTDITPRLMYDVSPNTEFGIMYELGEFWTDNDDLKAMCSEYVNSSWWVFAAEDAEGTASSLAVDFVANRTSSDTTMGATACMLAGVVVVALMRHCEVAMRRKTIDDMGEDAVYGAV